MRVLDVDGLLHLLQSGHGGMDGEVREEEGR